MFPAIFFAAASRLRGETPPTGLKPARVLQLKATTAHVQGIDTDGTHLWLTSVDRGLRKGYLQQFAVADGRLERTIEVQDGDRYHPGGMTADAGSLWIPVAEYRAASTSVIQKRSQQTLALEFEFKASDHIGCIASTGETLIGANWDSRDFYIWNRKGEVLKKAANTSGNKYQDLKMRDGRLVGSGLLAGGKGAVDWLDARNLQVLHRLPMGNTERSQPLTREGMTIVGNQLWLLPEDGDSRLYVFELPATARK
jgi:hypothetical protein